MAEPKLDSLRDILDKAEALSALSAAFSEKVDATLDEKTQEDIKGLLESVPKLVRLIKVEVGNRTEQLESELDKSHEKEKEMGRQLLEFSNLFNTYKEKIAADLGRMSEENKAFATENGLLKQHNRLLQTKLDIYEDTMIKIRAHQKRKENLELIKKSLEEEDEDIAKTITNLLSLERK